MHCLPCSQCGRATHEQPCNAATILTTDVQPPAVQPDDHCSAQLADPLLGPLLLGKESGRKPTPQIWVEQTDIPDVCYRFGISYKSAMAFFDGSMHKQPTSRIMSSSKKIAGEILGTLHEGIAGGQGNRYTRSERQLYSVGRSLRHSGSIAHHCSPQAEEQIFSASASPNS